MTYTCPHCGKQFTRIAGRAYGVFPAHKYGDNPCTGSGRRLSVSGITVDETGRILTKREER